MHFNSKHPGLSQGWEGAMLRKQATKTEALKQLRAVNEGS